LFQWATTAKSNSACWSRTMSMRTSSSFHWKLTHSRHDIAEKLLHWRWTTITHSLYIVFYFITLAITPPMRSTIYMIIIRYISFTPFECIVYNIPSFKYSDHVTACILGFKFRS
jgi:hypothetical protein